MRRITAFFLIFSLTGCYSWVGTGPAELERGDRVRVYLSEPSSFDVGSLTANNVVRLDAENVRWEDGQLVLSAWWLTAAGGREFAGDGRTVYVSGERIDLIERRQINGIETGLVVAGTVVGLVLLGAAVGGTGGAGGNGGGNGGTPQ